MKTKLFLAVLLLGSACQQAPQIAPEPLTQKPARVYLSATFSFEDGTQQQSEVIILDGVK